MCVYTKYQIIHAYVALNQKNSSVRRVQRGADGQGASVKLSAYAKVDCIVCTIRVQIYKVNLLHFHIQYVFSWCMCLQEGNSRSVCVCARQCKCQRGVKLMCQMSELSVRVVAPTRVAGCRDNQSRSV